MKKVFSSKEDVAHLWANEVQDSAKVSGNKLFFNNKTIYSYGNHFPIARIIQKGKDKYTLFTTKTYSSTTGKHISIVHRANHLPIIWMENIPDVSDKDLFKLKITDGVHQLNLKKWVDDIKECLDKLQRARKKEIYILKCENICKEINKYLEFFNLKASKEIKNLLENCNSSNYEAYLIANKKRIKADISRKKALRIKKSKQDLGKWRNFEIKSFYNNFSDFDYLRYNKDKCLFETSQFVHIPEKEGIDFYEKILKWIESDTNKDYGRFMDKYPIISINKDYVKIGCHKIEVSEIKQVIQDYYEYNNRTREMVSTSTRN